MANNTSISGIATATIDAVFGRGATDAVLDALGLDRTMATPGPLERFGTAPGASYAAKAGDTLSGIAEKHGTTWQTLARINGIADPNKIAVGQQIRLPAGASTSHVVQRGETLSAIAAANGTTVQALARANGIADLNRIYPGQQLRIGAATNSQLATVAPGAASLAPDGRSPPDQDPRAEDHRLGSISEVYESGRRGPGTVSTGANDPGGVSYGIYQLSSNAGTLSSFMRTEGARWASEFGGARPGSGAFSDAWRSIAQREPEAFRRAQHAFIERTHYQPAVSAASNRTGLDLNTRHNAVRDAAWSVSVQHGGAATILADAVARTDRQMARTDLGYDRALINNIYDRRTEYVLNVARTSTRLTAGERAQLVSVTENRYPAERRDALAMLDQQPADRPASAALGAPTRATGTIDGNAVARANGVEVKSASVRIARLDANMEPVIEAVATAARRLGLPTPVITSGNDSRHRNGSLHYADQALDFRGNNITLAQGQRLEAEVKAILGDRYDIDFEVFSNSTNNHLHVEYDPS